MLIIRKIGKLVRGKATPAQIILAAVLGCMLGFVPDFRQAPGLVVTLGLLLVLLNANLFVATIAGLLAKAISIPALGVSFAVGRVLLDGPTSGLFAKAVNAPVLALFGLEYYATTGGVTVGLLLGLVLGVALVKGLTRFRTLMMGLEDSSPRFVAIANRWWAKLLAWLLVGKGAAPGRETYEKILQRKLGNPIRPVGAVLAVLAVGLLAVLYQFASEPIVTAALTRGMERANGATVDIERVELDLAGGKLAISGLAMADANDLDRNLITAKRLEADISADQLLRKRFAMDRLVLVDAATGTPRATPGRVVGEKPEPSPPAEVGEGYETLEEYLAKARTWKQRLARVRQWMDRIASSGGDAGDPETTRDPAAQARIHGYTRVRADHLIEGSPTFAIYHLEAQGVRPAQFPGETLTILGHNLSTQPHLLEQAPHLLVESSMGTFRAELGRDPAAGGGANTLAFHYRRIPTERVVPQLAAKEPPLAGGTVDLEVKEGTWSAGAPITIDLPLTITVRDATLNVPGGKPARIEELVLPIGVRGPLDNPRIRLDDDQLADALVRAGIDEATAELRREATSKIDEVLEDVKKDAGVDLDAAGEELKKGLGDLLKKKDDPEG